MKHPGPLSRRMQKAVRFSQYGFVAFIAVALLAGPGLALLGLRGVNLFGQEWFWLHVAVASPFILSQLFLWISRPRKKKKIR